ncbi:MAG: hypothetical protein JWO62_3481 [Acidimicrobiaceae bacterium]|jgi:hypothetical protein|nr:hypothetical protein [Acidimicrobiaceae bacterium]
MPTSPIAHLPATSGAPPGPGARRPWYRGRAALLSVGVVVVVAVTVITDLPSHSTRANNINDARSVIAEVSTDAQPCNLGLTEALGFYADVTSGHITPAHRAEIPSLIRDDLNACSYVNASIDDLASIDNPASATGRQLNAITNNVLVWCDPDALTAIGQITTLLDHPGTAAARTKLAGAERLLKSDRAAAYANIAKLARSLGSSLHSSLRLVAAP